MNTDDKKIQENELSTDEKIIKYLRFCAKFLRHNTGDKGSGSQRRVLFMLHEYGTMTQRDILGKFDIRASSLSELLSKLETKEYIIKTKNEIDKRNYDVSITPAGLDALKEMQAQYTLTATDFLSDISANDKEQLSILLEKLHKKWSQREDNSSHHKHK